MPDPRLMGPQEKKKEAGQAKGQSLSLSLSLSLSPSHHAARILKGHPLPFLHGRERPRAFGTPVITEKEDYIRELLSKAHGMGSIAPLAFRPAKWGPGIG